MKTDFLYKESTEEINKSFYEVYNDLGYGFLESVYENALAIELKAVRVYLRKSAADKRSRYVSNVTTW